MRSEIERLRNRAALLADQLGRQDHQPVAGAPSFLAQTKILHTYPVTPQSFFALKPLSLLGTEAEGGEGSITTNPTTFYALNVGGSVPPVGAQVLVTFVGNRWVFKYDA